MSLAPDSRGALKPLLLAALVLALARSPLAVRVPLLAVFDGPPGAGLLGLAFAVAGARLLGPERAETWRARLLTTPPWALDLTLALVFVAVGLRYAARLQASGDEPHYLVMAQSLWREHDLDLRDNYSRQDFLDYTPGPLTPHYASPREDGRPYPAHSPGLPLLLAPVYAIGGRAACVMAMGLVAALAAGEIRRLAASVAGDRESAVFGWALAAGPPLAFYSFHLYTEAPSVFCVSLSLRLLLDSPRWRGASGAALAAAALPFLHVKMVAAAAALGVIAISRLRGTARAAFLTVAALAALAFLAYYSFVFGTPSPLSIYGGVPRDASGSPLIAMLGLFLDRSFGLLPYAPAFVLALAGAVQLVRRPPGIWWPHALVAVATLLPVLAWRMWWGGQCPPARFLVPLVPTLCVAATCGVAATHRGLSRWRWGLIGIGIALTVFAVARPEDRLLLNRGERPTRLWEALSGTTSLGRYLPSLVAGDSEELRVAAVWVGVLVVLLALHAAAQKRDDVDQLLREPAVPLGLLLLAGLVIDWWARYGVS